MGPVLLHAFCLAGLLALGARAQTSAELAAINAYNTCVLGSRPYVAALESDLSNTCEARNRSPLSSCAALKQHHLCVQSALKTAKSCSGCSTLMVEEATQALQGADDASQIYGCYASAARSTCGEASSVSGSGSTSPTSNSNPSGGTTASENNEERADSLPLPSAVRAPSDTKSAAQVQQGSYDAWRARGNVLSRRTLFNDTRAPTRKRSDAASRKLRSPPAKPPLSGTSCGPSGRDASTEVSQALGSSTNPYAYPNFLGGKTLHVAALFYDDTAVPAQSPNNAVVPFAQVIAGQRSRVKLRLFCAGYRKVYLSGDSDPRLLKDVENTVYDTSNTVECGSQGVTTLATVEFWGDSSGSIPSFLELRALPNDDKSGGLICKHRVYLLKNKGQWESYLEPLRQEAEQP